MKILKPVGLLLVLLSATQVHAILPKCKAFETSCRYPLPEDGRDRDIAINMLEFFDMSDRIWEEERRRLALKEFKPRPEHLGQNERKPWLPKFTKGSIPGHLVDDTDDSTVSLFLEGATHQGALLIFKSFRRSHWFQFYPAGDNFYFISVAGVNAQGKYQPDLGLLYVDPKSSDLLRIGYVYPHDVTPPKLPAGQKDTRRMETPGVDFHLISNSLDRSAYLFRVHAAKDASKEGFYLLHSSGKWLGIPKDLEADPAKEGKEFFIYGWPQLASDFKDLHLFTFRLCDNATKYRKCLKF